MHCSYIFLALTHRYVVLMGELCVFIVRITMASHCINFSYSWEVLCNCQTSWIHTSLKEPAFLHQHISVLTAWQVWWELMLGFGIHKHQNKTIKHFDSYHITNKMLLIYIVNSGDQNTSSHRGLSSDRWINLHDLSPYTFNCAKCYRWKFLWKLSFITETAMLIYSKIGLSLVTIIK